MEDNPARNEATVNILQDFHSKDTDNFGDAEHVNPTILATIMRQLDDL